jgi:hypothetical protein
MLGLDPSIQVTPRRCEEAQPTWQSPNCGKTYDENPAFFSSFQRTLESSIPSTTRSIDQGVEKKPCESGAFFVGDPGL